MKTEAQTNSFDLRPGIPATTRLRVGDSVSYSLSLKNKGVADIAWLYNEGANFRVQLFDPNGREITTDYGFEEGGSVFVASLEGIYVVKISYQKSESSEYFPNANEPQSLTISYRDSFKLPAGSKSKGIRQINGYAIKISETSENSAVGEKSFVTVERAGRFEAILRSDGGGAAGFSFADTCDGCGPLPKGSPPQWIYGAQVASRSTAVIKATADKTGDGRPDIMLTHFSGGAHCCTTTLVAELGEQFRMLPVIYSGNADIVSVSRNPKGGVLIGIGDDTFAYWNTSFAASPMPHVTLEYKNGMFRPAFGLMRKAPPALAVLRRKAQEDSAYIGNGAYQGSDSADFSAAFWGEMLDLIYTGNESLAWQYLDLVWPVGKRGKEKFKSDFLEQLDSSPYWQMIQEDLITGKQ